MPTAEATDEGGDVAKKETEEGVVKVDGEAGPTDTTAQANTEFTNTTPEAVQSEKSELPDVQRKSQEEP